MLNPLRSEGEAFRFLLYAIAVVVAVIVWSCCSARDLLSGGRPCYQPDAPPRR